MKMNAHVLSIDPGASMGVSLMGPDGTLIGYRELKMRDAELRSAVIRESVRRCVASGTDLVVVREKWQAGGPKQRWSTSTIAGLGAAWGIWMEQFRLCAPWLPKSRFHAVYPSTWRKNVLGAHAKGKEGWAVLAKNYVTSRFDIEDPGPEAAVAICIGVYAFTSPKVAASAQERPMWHRKLPSKSWDWKVKVSDASVFARRTDGD